MYLMCTHWNPLSKTISVSGYEILTLTALITAVADNILIFSSPVRSTRRAIVVTPVVRVCVPVPVTLR